MDAIKSNAHKCRTPSATDRVFKDECVLSFDNPETETGLYVCLSTFLGFGREHVERCSERTGNLIFLHLRRIKIPKQTQTSEDNNCHPKKITKLAIGIEGGYNPEEESSLFDIEDQRSIVVLPSFKTIPVDSDDLPQQVKNSIYGILSAVSASRADEAQALAGTWDGEKRQVSRHAPNLVQLDNGKSIPPSGWKCEKCDKTDNLWLNLTDGSILCGRKFFDGTGGNNHAVEHYNEFKYPLAVKLGTITPDGADVYSYDEDDMVEDPLLDKHLSHFGINVAQMKKTEKSMLELELDYNQRIGEWSLLTESDAILKPLYGSGFTGLANLGNSCYLNSVVQVLFSIPEFQSFYYPGDKFTRCPPSDPSLDFNCQMAKLAHGILSGKYSKAPEGTTLQEQEGIKPNMFKNLIGRGHPEFSTKRQQDAQEFFLHLINMIDRNSRIQGCDSPTKALCFEVEDRVECMASKKVRYTCRTEYILALPVPLEKMINRKEVTEYEAKKAAGETLDPKDVIRPKVHLDACFESLVQPEVISDFYSTAIAGKTTASKSSRLKTFPNYLMLQIKKFELGQDWLPKKLDIAVDVPDILDLAKLRGHGLEPGEEILPEGPTSGADSDASSASVVVFDSQAQAQINSLMDMGFSMDACKRAVHATANSGLEAALTWLCEHSTDPDFNDPFTLDQASGATGSSFIPNPEALESLKSMGLPEEAAIRGLKETSNNVERAVEWIFSHPEAMEPSPLEVPTSSAPVADQQGSGCRDGSEKYRLKAFISHMGSSTMCGHYVCHILKDGKWVIFNDNKVALSECPPKQLAYLYLYERM